MWADSVSTGTSSVEGSLTCGSHSSSRKRRQRCRSSTKSQRAFNRRLRLCYEGLRLSNGWIVDPCLDAQVSGAGTSCSIVDAVDSDSPSSVVDADDGGCGSDKSIADNLREHAASDAHDADFRKGVDFWILNCNSWPY